MRWIRAQVRIRRALRFIAGLTRTTPAVLAGVVIPGPGEVRELLEKARPVDAIRLAGENAM
jgi:hypothetical protein